MGPFRLVHPEARARAARATQEAPDGYIVKILPPTRSLAQNARMWAMLSDISRQVVHHGRRLTDESWKCVFSAALKKQDVVPGLTPGDFVVIGHHTSSMTKQELSDMLELIGEFGARNDVRWSEPTEAAA